MRIAAILSYLDQTGIPYSFTGNTEGEVERFSSLVHYQEGSFTWIKAQKNIPDGFDLSRLALVFTSPDVDTGLAPNVIRTPEGKHAFFGTIEHFYDEEEQRPAIGQFTYIGPKVKLGKDVRIGHNCTLDGDITIGDGTVIWNHVTIVNRVTIGKNCDIQSGTVIGHDGFGYTEAESHLKTMIKHFGGVQIGDFVHLGMNNVIARGVIDDTMIGSGTKMSDLCHIGHNNVIGKNCTIINSALFGSCNTEDNAYIVYSVIKNQTHIGKNSFVGMASNVLSNVENDTIVVGNPAKILRKKGV